MPAVAYARSPLRNLISIVFFVVLMVVLSWRLVVFAGMDTAERAPGSAFFLYGMVGLVDVVFLVVIALLTWAIVRQRRSAPQLRLDDGGITVYGFDGRIPWADILRADVARVRWVAHVSVTLVLRDDHARYVDLLRAQPAEHLPADAAKFNLVLTDMGVDPQTFFKQMNERRSRLGLTPLASTTGY